MGRRVVWAAVLAGVLALPSMLVAQDRQISGTVTRQGTATPLSEATVTAVGGRGAARTNSEGKFTITVGPGDARLAVRAIGYQRREVVVPAGQSTVNVALSEDIFKLEEVVITGQATTLEKRNATTATATIDNSDITKAPTQSLEQGLQGKVLGASINLNSGAPGGGGQIQIRGVTSILGNGQPLFVVDGVIISNDGFSSGSNAVTGAGGGAIATTQDAVVNRLADLNPQEIESIEVLKSAAATAIYGSRATNGVVVIKTKRGAPGQARFNLTQRVGFSEPLRLLGSRVWTSVDDVINDAGATGYFSGYAPNDPIFANFPGGVIPASANRDLAELFYSNRKPSYETTANISGGSETLQYFVAATNRQEVGLANRTGARLQSIRGNVDQAWNTKFKTSVSLNITRNVLNRGLSNNDNTFTSPIYNFAYTPSIFDLDRRDPETGAFPESPLNGGGNSASNPFQTFEFLKATEDVFRQTGSASQFFTPLQNDKNTVVLSVLGGFDRFQQIGDVVSPGFLQYEGNDGFIGRAVKSTINVLNYNLQLSGNWTHNAKSASFTTTAGFSYERQGTEAVRLRSRGILPGTTTVGQGTIDGTNSFSEFRDQAFFASEQVLAFNNRLAVNAGFRADRSSANGDVGKFYFFPRASASYNFEKVGPFSSLKLRGGYGETGNRPRFADRDVTLATGSVIGGLPSAVTAGLVGNPGIRPETLQEAEGGIDFTAFDNKVQFEGTFYSRRIANQLLQPQVAPSSGVTNLVVNAGRLKNEGVELGMTVVPVNTADVQWQSRVTFQKNKQRIIDLPTEVPPFPVPGSFGSAFGRNRIVNGGITTAIWGGVPVNATTLEYLPFGTCALVACTAANGIAIRDTIVGDANPDFQMFFNNSVSYKRMTLGFTFDWRRGGDVVNLTQTLYDEGGNSRDYTDPITSIDQLQRNGFPGGVVDLDDIAGQRLGEFRYNAWDGGRDARAFLNDGSFVRLRDISLSYDAPQTVATSFGARSLRFNLQARNVAIWSKYWGFDPEFNNFGNSNLNRFIDLAPFPGARQFAVSVDVGF